MKATPAAPKRPASRKRSAIDAKNQLQEARKQSALRWDAEQARLVEATEQLESGKRQLQLMDLPNEVLALIFCPHPCPRRSASPEHVYVCECGLDYRKLCTLLCRRTYELYRSKISRINLTVTIRTDRVFYNHLRGCAQAPTPWQATVATLIPMTALRSIMFHVHRDMLATQKRVMYRAAAPWYYLMTVTSLEQRRSMKLRFGWLNSSVLEFANMQLPIDVYLFILQFKSIKVPCENHAIIFLDSLKCAMVNAEAYLARRAIDARTIQIPTICYYNSGQPPSTDLWSQYYTRARPWKYSKIKFMLQNVKNHDAPADLGRTTEKMYHIYELTADDPDSIQIALVGESKWMARKPRRY